MNKLAFPQPPFWDQAEQRWRNIADAGLTLREYAAVHVLQGVLANYYEFAKFKNVADAPVEEMVKMAMQFTDGLLKELESKP